MSNITTLTTAAPTFSVDALVIKMKARDKRGGPQSDAAIDIAHLVHSDQTYADIEFVGFVDGMIAERRASNYVQNARNYITRQGLDVRVSKRGTNVFLIDMSKLTPEERAKVIAALR